MQRKVYLVRHAESDFSVHDDYSRPLTEKGMADTKKVTRFLKDKDITAVYSSPFKRAIDTVRDFALSQNLSITEVSDFRERKVSSGWIEDFTDFSKNQWNDFDYKRREGESLSEVQERNINALETVLKTHPQSNVVIGTHGTSLSTLINYYNPHFGLEDFNRIKNKMPLIIQKDKPVSIFKLFYSLLI